METLFHYLWQHGMVGRRFTASDGTSVELLSPGQHNNDAGPDFSGARMMHKGNEWSGNVEIHVKASDWYRHKHDNDPKYDNVILHVVAVDDTVVKRSDGSELLTVCVSPPRELYERYALLAVEMDRPRCIPFLNEIPELNRTDWIESLGIERLQAKARYMKEVLDSTGGDWQQTLFILISRAFGFGLNSVPFEMLARSLPLNFAMRHKDHPEQLEALVFGQAGFLDQSILSSDGYYQLLCREYKFLRAKYSLQPIGPGLWKYSRTRPQNFPHRRLAILASLMRFGMQFKDLLMISKGDPDIIFPYFEVKASDYWKSHFNFGKDSVEYLPVALSRSSIEVIVVNVGAPFFQAYGSILGNPEFAEKGTDLLRLLRPERNSIVSTWEGATFKCRNAFESQAMIQLNREYCRKNRCLECRFGHYIMRSACMGK